MHIKEYKKITRKINNELNVKNEKLNKAMEVLEDNIKTNKEVVFNKDYVKIKKETFDNMNLVIKETKKVMEVQPKLQKVFQEINSYNQSYQSLQKENKNIQREVNHLKNKNEELQKENNNLISYINAILEAVKRFFRQILKVGNKEAQSEACVEIKDFYDNNDLNKYDVVDIARDTDKEDELFDYIDYEKEYNTDYDKDDFDMSL